MKENRSATAVFDENPYLQQVPETHQRVGTYAADETFSPDVVDEQTADEYRYEEPRKRGGRRRLLVLGGLAMILLASSLVAVRYYRPTIADFPGTRATTRSSLPARSDATSGPDSRTQKAIAEAQQLMVDTAAPTARDASTSSTTPPSETVAGPSTQAEAGFHVTPEFGATVKTKTSEPWTTVGSSGTKEKQESAPPPPAQPRNSNAARSNEGSIYANDPRSAPAEASSQRASTASSPAASVKLPPFVMLPVRTLGGFYTLRNRALVRLELTRDMSGAGWFMKRGTVLVGTSEGTDVDRAHVSIIGFLDQQSGRFVKVGGDLLGNDGTPGIKGKRRQIDSGWARMLSKVGTGALNLTSSFLGGHGNGTVIVSDGLRARAVNPITDEISGIVGGELDQQRGRSFVEVTAGSPGYVMITDLPASKESESAPAPQGQYLASLTDVDITRSATGLSERELADLLSTGSPTEIKAAMSRMSPEMRHLATAFLDR